MGLLASPEATSLANEAHLSVCPPLIPCSGWGEVHPSIHPPTHPSIHPSAPPWQEPWDVPGTAAPNPVRGPWACPLGTPSTRCPEHPIHHEGGGQLNSSRCHQMVTPSGDLAKPITRRVLEPLHLLSDSLYWSHGETGGSSGQWR